MPRLVVLILLGSLLLGACGAPEPDCTRADVICAGLVTDFGNVNSGEARQAWLGLQDAQAAHLLDRIDVIETVDVRDRALNLQTLAADGYDLIVAVGAGISDETTAAATHYPHLKFIGVQQAQAAPLPNLAGLVFHEEYSGFMAGALAALMTQTGHVAAICEPNYIESMRRYCDGFMEGAHYLRPGLDVTVTYHGGDTRNVFNDPEWGQTAALQQVNQGADVVFAAGGQTAQAALEAAGGQGVYVIGADTDQYLDLATVRPFLLSSAMSDVRSGIVEIVTLMRRGQFPSGEFVGDVKLAPWHDLDRQVPSDVKARLQEIGLGLQLGTLKIEVPYQQP